MDIEQLFASVSNAAERAFSEDPISPSSLTELKDSLRQLNGVSKFHKREFFRKTYVYRQKNLTLLHIAACINDVELAGLLMDNYADGELVDSQYGYSPLNIAVTKNHTKMVEFFVKRNAGINVVTTWGHTPLHLALSDAPEGHKPNLDIASILCHRMNQYLYLADITGHRPLYYAVSRGDYHTSHWLLERYVRGAIDTEVHELLHLILAKQLKKEDDTLVRHIFNCLHNIDVTDDEGNTPLHCASSKGHLEVAMFLVEAGANVNAVNKVRKRPIQVASSGIVVDLGTAIKKYLSDKKKIEEEVARRTAKLQAQNEAAKAMGL